jgi:hypothetical protein
MGDQVDRNYQTFMAQLPALIRTHAGKFALMHDGEIVEFFETAGDAYLAGLKLYNSDTAFSVQQVVKGAVDLGFYSHAVS